MTRFPRILLFALLLAASLPVCAAGPTGLLNDTGQNTCDNWDTYGYHDSSTMVACATANSGNAAAYPRQDGRFGRDAAAAAGVLVKIGAGTNGFDYTKICMSGNAEGTGTCPSNPTANTTPAPAATEWACTKDNVTNLVWSLDSPINKYTWTYATTTYPATINATNRCGYSTGWRLPTRRELLSIAHSGLTAYEPNIDSAYFPGPTDNHYWSADSYTLYAPDYAWAVYFYDGSANYYSKTYSYYVRLVRSGP